MLVRAQTYQSPPFLEARRAFRSSHPPRMVRVETEPPLPGPFAPKQPLEPTQCDRPHSESRIEFDEGAKLLPAAR